jgi:hypothetical protein
MKKGIIFLALSIILTSNIINAQETSSSSLDRKHQLGIRISSQDAAVNHSISYKYFFSSTIAGEALFTFSDPAAIGLLVEKHTALGSSGASWFWGAGPYLGFGSERRFGLQGIGGFDFLFPNLPINLSVDWKPEINFTKKFSFEPAAVGVSARFAF